MKIKFRQTRVFTFLLTLLLLGGAGNKAWAATVTYHVLTLPMSSSVYNIKATYDGKRLEAIQVKVDNATSVELPVQFKSPLATNFKYYKADQVTKSATAENLYDNGSNKAYIYELIATPTATPEGDPVSSNIDIYVTYDYKYAASETGNTIAKLNGSANYNIAVNKGFLAYNKGRNNRPAVVPRNMVTAEQLVSPTFVKLNVSGSGITTYWSSGDNKNDRADNESKFHFLFKFVGQDPYNIIIRTAYAGDSVYIEKNDDDKKFVYKYYRDGSLFGVSTNNNYIASDDHILYTKVYTDGTSPKQGVPISESKPGRFHGQAAPIWGSFALLNNTKEDGYIFMASRTNNDDGNFNGPAGSKNNYSYNFLKFDNANLTINKLTPANATASYSTDKKLYEVKTVYFKVKTPFYAIEESNDHIVSASVTMSEYKVDNSVISKDDIPEELKRKYCNFTTFRNSSGTVITKYSQMNPDGIIFVDYEYAASIPFKGITPKSTYTAADFTGASWYELTDEGSTEENGKKLVYDGSSNFKNNGASGSYEKTSEFAFIGDPYEMRVILRSATSGATPAYVGATGTPDSPTNLSVITTTPTAGYKWEIPYDSPTGSFLLKLYKGEGTWNWTATNQSQDVIYGSSYPSVNITSNAQTVTFNVSGLAVADGNYIKVTKGDTAGDAQILSTTPTLNTGKGGVTSTGTGTVTATIAANTTGSSKTFTLTITEYNSSDEVVETASVITITQGTTAYTGNTVEYSTASSTRVKVLNLPQRNYVFHIVDKSGRIAAKASVREDIYTVLSVASIPSIIVSPFIVDEELTFYSTYTDGAGRSTLTGQISETPYTAPETHYNIYVKYKTANLDKKPITLSENQQFNVKLHEEYLYYDATNNCIKSKATPTDDEKKTNAYLWKLRNRDPYAMLIDNLGARADMGVSGSTSIITVYDDNGGTSSASRENGAWVWLNGVALPATGEGTALAFTTTRTGADGAQQFIAKASTAGGVYEVMVAAGDGVDASTTYYNIGLSATDVIKVYNNTTYAHGDDVLRFRLEQTTGYTYHLIDKAKHKLLEVKTNSPELILPSEYQSPLVAAYHYYARNDINIVGDVYTVVAEPTPLTILTDLDVKYDAPTGSNSSEWGGATEGFKQTANDDDDMLSKVKEFATGGMYYFKIGESTYKKVNVTRGYRGTDIYVTYEKNDLVNYNDNASPYLLKFLQPHSYFLEDGNDGLTTEKLDAVYPYTNGDGNLNIYGTKMNKEQMEGGANTRPRWVWFFESKNSDPYHVKIHSRSTISYNGISHPTYLQTSSVHFNQDAVSSTKHIVTGGALPTIASVEPTEYMILGTEGRYKLMTTQEIEGSRRTVTSLEQYWKTYNMLKLEVLRIEKSTNSFDGPETMPTDKWSELKTALDTKGVNNSSDPNYIDGCNWHSYNAYANATRWNGYNDKSDGEEKKVVEQQEHWFQTFDMGDGSFDIVGANIPPVLILLDRHGWEIMRRPLPNISTYPEGDDELNALRAYDSPLVKEYKFYSNATKASGCHKYSIRLNDDKEERDQIKVDGKLYTSTSLADLPPLAASGVKSNGVLNDQYVTYTVKEEYEKSYTYNLELNEESSTYTESGTASKFLVVLDGRYTRYVKNGAKDSYLSKPIIEATNPTGGNVYDMILSPSTTNYSEGYPAPDANNNGVIDDVHLWYVEPNLDIDDEMGIKWGTSNDTTKAEPLSRFGTRKKYKGKTGFDPYNLQIKNVSDSRYLTIDLSSTTLTNGIWEGTLSAPGVYAAAKTASEYVEPEGYDHTTLQITKQTFMAVSDANGNMQLMPRFDHTKRIHLEGSSPWYTTLAEPENHAKASVDNNASMGAQTVFFVRPQKIDYRIIDNEGNEALRYQRAGDYYPEITEHFKSPLATDFKYYKTAPSYDGSTKTLTVSDEITGSLAGSGLNSDNPTVYVRYSYNENYDKDNDKILQGKWFTIDLAGKNVQSTETTINSAGDNVFLYSGTKSSDAPIDGADGKRKWQWKFLVAPIDPTSEYHESPDPYAIKLFNRKANYSTDLSPSSPMSIPVKVNTRNSFSLLSHPDGGYALAVNGLGTYSYDFLNGASMDEDDPATTTNEVGFTYKANTISAGAKLVVNDDVTHNYTYNVINGKKIIAVTGSQTYAEAEGNDFAPYLPDDAQTPLLDADKDYEYYGSVSGTFGTYAVVDMTKLFTLHGLYDDVVYVTYKAYGEKEAVDGSGNVTPGPTSQDASMNIKGELPYNIVWYADNMMKAVDTSEQENGIYDGINKDPSHELSGNTEHIWYFEGDDPYALQIKNKGGKYVNGSDLVALVDKASAPDFMLLKKSDYDYGILQKAGLTDRLSGYGQTTTTGDPTKFIIFGLSVHDLIYHLIIAKTCANTASPGTGEYVDIKFRETESGALTDKRIYGTSQRDLTSGSPAGATYQLGTTQTWGGASHTYSHHVGAVSIGDVLQVPSVFYRPNCSWDYYIEGIYSTDGTTSQTDLDNKYKGLKLTNLMSDEDLINKTVVVNIVYSFNKDLTTNSGLDFVRSTGQNLWYTMETNDAGDPWLARYTKTQGLTAIAGRETHYTNDYLFTPVGDVYGFKMYNRYTVKNSNESNDNDLTKVMTTASLADNVPVTVDVPSSGYEVYELIEGDVPGYFRIHPVVNYTGTQYYIKRNGSSLQLSTTSQDWTFGLDMAMLQPYYLGAGNVGGLNAAGKTAYKNEIDKGEGKYKITDLQNIVYNDANIVHFTSGYYRLHSQPGITGISPVRYASGYLHDIEKTAGTSSTPIPLHFYSKAGVTTTFGDSGLKSGYTKTDATQGDIPVPATENDPSTIFYVTGSNLTNNTLSNVAMGTQGLNVIENKMGTGTATTYRLIDIGGGIVVLLEPTSGNYLTFDQNETNKYDLHYKSTFRIDDVKWCMVPADSLMVTTNNGGDGYYYSTLYLPYDVLLPADAGGKTYNAYVCKKWYNEGVNPVPVPAVTGTPSYAEGKLVPAGTPVIIRTNDESGNMKLTLPNTTASTALPCVFTGTYLEKLLAADASHKVYTLGLPYTSDMDLDSGTGDVTAPLPVQSTTGVGFYINANPYKEASEMQSGWTRNNRYVLHNKIYYRATADPGASAPQQRAPEFVPVIFGDEEEQKEMNPNGTMEMVGDGCIYDLMGRKVATREQVEDGSWWNQATPGVYILNGRKVIKK